MQKKLHRIGRFYSSVIINNIGIFLFLGVLGVLFSEQGWYPNQSIQSVFQIVYRIILPAMIAFEAGRRMGEQTGGILAVLSVSGILISNSEVGILAAMTLGPLAGMIWKKISVLLKKYVESSLGMLFTNLMMALLGVSLSFIGYFLITPVLAGMILAASRGVDFMISHRLTAVLSLMIEPAKVFFLNNVVNHGILVPLALNQAEAAGSSILFLLEANPGPGFGMLAALYYMDRTKRQEYASAMFAEAAGGLHEVYFPFALSNLWLLPALIAGGVTGSLCFDLLGAGLQGVVSPGSVITILLLAGKGHFWATLMGILLSAVVSFHVSMMILKLEKMREQRKENAAMTEHESAVSKETKTETDTAVSEEIKIETDTTAEVCEENAGRIHLIGFVCDAGVGSSAMGAAIFRRKLRTCHLTELQVEAYAADQIPSNLDVCICQKAFFPLLDLKSQNTEIWLVESFAAIEEYDRLLDRIQKRNR
ncbi:MAG: hypothetical protein PHG16_11710 [Lachnospiraceae bacterium]|nr:hypothetical protein [Lachnospiraceae bacterium]